MADEKKDDNKQAKTTSQRLEEALKQLSKDQLRFVVALQEHSTKMAAARSIRLKPELVYRWPPMVDEAARLLALDSLESARVLRRRNLVKAMGVKAAGLNSKDERIRQNTATEIIEWELGKAQQKTDLTSGNKPLAGVIEIVEHKTDG